MSLLEKSKKHIQAYLAKLENASRPIKATNLTYTLALKQVLETWKELYENPYSENIDVEKYNEACKVIELSVNDISKIREVVIYYRNNSDEAEEFGHKLNQLFDYLPMSEMHLYIGTIALPYYRMSFYQDRRGKSYRSWLKEFNDNVNVCPEPDDVYSALLAIDDTELAVKILSESGYSASEQSELISTFMDSNKKDEFCSLLSRNPIGLRSFSGLCFISEGFNAFSGLLDKPVNSLQGSIKFVKALQNLATVCIDAIDRDTYVEAKEEISFIDSMNQMVQSISENNTFDISKFSSFCDRLDEFGYDTYKDLLNTIEESTPAERIIFERVLNRPEGQPYIQYLKRKFAEEEQEPEEQLVQQQMDTPSEDAIPQNDSPQEDTGLQERTHKACDFSKYDGLFDTRGDLPNKNEYLEVLNAKFKKDGVWPVLLAFLYQHGYLSLPDIPRFVYRMTGKRVGNFSLITKIEWKNHPEDLHYLCTALHGSVPIINMKAFFDFGKDDKRFHGKYDPTSEMKSFLKINFEYTK